jgi:hypothetical protein
MSLWAALPEFQVSSLIPPPTFCFPNFCFSPRSCPFLSGAPNGLVGLNTAEVALEPGNSPQVIFRYCRELVRTADPEKWFGITPARVEAAKATRKSGAAGKIVALPKVAAA